MCLAVCVWVGDDRGGLEVLGCGSGEQRGTQLLHWLHSTVARGLYLLLLGHLWRGLNYLSFGDSPVLWVTGWLLLLSLIVLSFLGYVLP